MVTASALCPLSQVTINVEDITPHPMLFTGYTTQASEAGLAATVLESDSGAMMWDLFLALPIAPLSQWAWL